MILDPDRVVFQRAVGVELEMIMVVIGVAVVLVHEILAEDMVGERVALFLVVIVGHSRRAPSNSAIDRIGWAVLSHGRFARVKTPVVRDRSRLLAQHGSAVIPGRAEGANPESSNHR